MKRKVKKIVDNPRRVENICFSRTCYIMYKTYCIGELTEESNDADEYDWVIKVYWDKWEEAGKPDIAGIDLDLRKEEYIRNI